MVVVNIVAGGGSKDSDEVYRIANPHASSLAHQLQLWKRTQIGTNVCFSKSLVKCFNVQQVQNAAWMEQGTRLVQTTC